MDERLKKVKCFLLDMDGTFYLGNRIIDGSLEFIDVLKNQGKDFIFLTNNSSKNRNHYVQKITELGLRISVEKVFTSGEATAIYIKDKYPNHKTIIFGTPLLIDELKSNGVVISSKNPDHVVLGFDTTITYKKLCKLVDLVRSGLPYIATHPDYVCPTENGYIPDIGAIIAFVKAATGRDPDIVIGKPNQYMIDAIVHKLQLRIDELAMVGDRLYTDIALGKNAGLTTCLVLSGETKIDEVENSIYIPDYIFQNLKEIGEYISK